MFSQRINTRLSSRNRATLSESFKANLDIGIDRINQKYFYFSDACRRIQQANVNGDKETETLCIYFLPVVTGYTRTHANHMFINLPDIRFMRFTIIYVQVG